MEFIKRTAVELVGMLSRGDVSPGELLESLAARIAEVEPTVNALPTLCLDRARADAERARHCAPLHGLPVAIKDLTPVAGVRTTYGSPIFADFVP